VITGSSSGICLWCLLLTFKFQSPASMEPMVDRKGGQQPAGRNSSVPDLSRDLPSSGSEERGKKMISWQDQRPREKKGKDEKLLCPHLFTQTSGSFVRHRAPPACPPQSSAEDMLYPSQSRLPSPASPCSPPRYKRTGLLVSPAKQLSHASKGFSLVLPAGRTPMVFLSETSTPQSLTPG
jgi:hypothetical protein